jgi:2-polyprenyl-6-methoxyphenol hydroxylase-like FAD-dependent oxidoreductase
MGDGTGPPQMRDIDVAIVGGGLAGSLAAAMLGRAGIAAALVDPHPVYPPDLRCEKLGGNQIARLMRTGLADDILPATTLDGQVWEARFGCVVDRKPSDQRGILYDALVNAARAAIPPKVERVVGKVTAIRTSDDRQHLELSDGTTLSARLAVLATGPSVSLRHALGLERRIVSANHSITLGFDLAPLGRDAFAFPALTYWTSRACDRYAYLTLFPVGRTMRANLMVYREADDPWLRLMRRNPEAAMRQLMPRLERIAGPFRVDGAVRIRPADLYVTEGHRQAGIVLVGDAFGTSCPAAGTGTDKVFTDVERLCNVYVPRWIASPGMGAEKIAAFYDDAEKRACDAWSLAKAHRLKALSTGTTPGPQLGRYGRFLVRSAQGGFRRLRRPVYHGSHAPTLPAGKSRPA